MGFKKYRVLICTALFLAMGHFSYAQSENDNEKSMAVKIDENSDFFDALRLRSDLRFRIQKRILFTTIGDIEAFHQKYKDTEMTLEYVIRDRLHTAIFLDQKKNTLQSMDGSDFGLSPNQSASELTDQLVSLIGSMYYGADEVEALGQ